MVNFKCVYIRFRYEKVIYCTAIDKNSVPNNHYIL